MMWRSWDVAREKVFKKKVGTHIDTLFEGSPEDETSDTSETVDSYVGHDSLSRGGGLMNKLAIKLKENLKMRKKYYKLSSFKWEVHLWAYSKIHWGWGGGEGLMPVYL
jgi:CRISPR/Cas system CSM-associated protein Csm5 (group 7 of RAMP superfamily)